MPGTKTRDTALRERFKPLYVASFLQGFVFWFAIEKLFMTSIGLNSRTISIIVIVFATITLTMNVPMGVIADRWSRKGILMFASCCMIASCTIAGLSNGFWMYLVAACFFGLFQAGSQGVYDSLAYDVLMEDTGSANDYEYYRGRMQLYGGVALVLGGLMSAVITHYLNFRATYFLTIPFMLGSLAVLCYFREPREHKKEVSQLLGAHIHSTLNSILRKREVFWIVATLVLASVAAKMLLDFDQLWFIGIALPVALYGPFDALLVSSFTSGGFISSKLRNNKVVSLLGLVALASGSALFSHNGFIIIVVQTIIVSVLIVYSIVFERYLHDTLTSSIRVGAASVVSTIGGIVFLPTAYLFGWLSQRYSIFRASWVILALLAAAVLAGLKAMQKMHASVPAQCSASEVTDKK